MIELIDENKVNEYLENNKKKIGDIFNSKQHTTVEIKEIQKAQNVDFPGQDGVINSSITTYGRYYSEDKVIKINTEAIAKKLEDMKNSLYHQHKVFSESDKISLYKFVDLILLHEYAHAYQNQIEGKKMKKNNYELEVEADDISKRIFMKDYEGIPDRIAEMLLKEFEEHHKYLQNVIKLSGNMSRP